MINSLMRSHLHQRLHLNPFILPFYIPKLRILMQINFPLHIILTDFFNNGIFAI